MNKHVAMAGFVMTVASVMGGCTTHTHERDHPPAVIHQDIKDSDTHRDAAREGARDGVRDSLR